MDSKLYAKAVNAFQKAARASDVQSAFALQGGFDTSDPSNVASYPEWDGTFQWRKEQEAAKPPQKPDEKLVERLARETNLDPATGLPLAPAKSAKVERVPLDTIARSG